MLSSLASYLFDRPKSGPWRPSYDDLEAAHRNATRVIVCLRCFRWHAKRRFPHRKDFPEVVDQVLQILHEKNGNMYPHDAFSKWQSDWNGSGFELPDPEMVKKWMDRPAIDQEFEVLRISEHFNPNRTVTEERISEMTSFLQQWVRNQRIG